MRIEICYLNYILQEARIDIRGHLKSFIKPFHLSFPINTLVTNALCTRSFMIHVHNENGFMTLVDVEGISHQHHLLWESHQHHHLDTYIRDGYNLQVLCQSFWEGFMCIIFFQKKNTPSISYKKFTYEIIMYKSLKGCDSSILCGCPLTQERERATIVRRRLVVVFQLHRSHP